MILLFKVRRIQRSHLAADLGVLLVFCYGACVMVHFSITVSFRFSHDGTPSRSRFRFRWGHLYWQWQPVVGDR